ncbi:unnamed protein product [Rangifer tarandus platyrhynchus]|uniref:Uncharacterized protein n=1 Tax=Rangifer tarandus platyrhynchus TaxID=3082113 RepID=A0AC59Y938_RANTA
MLQAERGAEEKNLRGTTFGTAEGGDWLGLMEDGAGSTNGREGVQARPALTLRPEALPLPAPGCITGPRDQSRCVTSSCVAQASCTTGRLSTFV